MKRQVLLYGVALALLTVSLRLLEYRLLFIDHAQEAYIAAIALLFTGVGVWAGSKLKERYGRRPLVSPSSLASFSVDQERLKQHGITAREYDVLCQIAQGLSTKEIADKLFVSINTVKSHSASLFQKLNAKRRTQAVQQAKSLGLLP